MTDREAESSTEEATPVWRYIPLDQYAAPKSSAREAVRKGFLGVLEKIPTVTWLRKKRRRTPDTPLIAQDDLHRLPTELLDQVTPAPTWTEPFEALQDRLTGASPDTPVQVVVGAPYSGVRAVITSWAESQEWTVVEPPAPEEILKGGRDWLSRLAEIPKGTPLALPCLEACYLRHHDGLKMIRQLMDWVLTQRNPYVLGCSSWAWSYLGKAANIDAFFPTPWTLEAMSQERLQQWFNALATQQGNQAVLFRQSDSGEFVLLPPDHPEKTDDSPKRHSDNTKHEPAQTKPELSDFLINLAAYSRGIPGIAWAIWRQSLRLAPDTEGKGEQPTPPPQATAHQRTLWVKPWSQVRLPALSVPPEHDQLLVLHTLLLHESLSEQCLARLLPFSSHAVLKLLNRLRNSGLLEPSPNGWRVTALGYPAVRQALANEEYLVDQL